MGVRHTALGHSPKAGSDHSFSIRTQQSKTSHLSSDTSDHRTKIIFVFSEKKRRGERGERRGEGRRGRGPRGASKHKPEAPIFIENRFPSPEARDKAWGILLSPPVLLLSFLCLFCFSSLLHQSRWKLRFGMQLPSCR